MSKVEELQKQIRKIEEEDRKLRDYLESEVREKFLNGVIPGIRRKIKRWGAPSHINVFLSSNGALGKGVEICNIHVIEGSAYVAPQTLLMEEEEVKEWREFANNLPKKYYFPFGAKKVKRGELIKVLNGLAKSAVDRVIKRKQKEIRDCRAILKKMD